MRDNALLILLFPLYFYDADDIRWLHQSSCKGGYSICMLSEIFKMRCTGILQHKVYLNYALLQYKSLKCSSHVTHMYRPHTCYTFVFGCMPQTPLNKMWTVKFSPFSVAISVPPLKNHLLCLCTIIWENIRTSICIYLIIPCRKYTHVCMALNNIKSHWSLTCAQAPM